jgi:hypothetical protein
MHYLLGFHLSQPIRAKCYLFLEDKTFKSKAEIELQLKAQKRPIH